MPDPITTPGFHDITEARYHADDLCDLPSLSRSIAKLLLDATPAHAYAAHPRLGAQAEEKKRQYDIGHAAEALILRGEAAFIEIGADSFRGKAAQEARDAAYEAGQIPLLIKDADAVRGMAEVARKQLESHEIGDVFATGRSSETLIWFEDGLPMRCRFDWLTSNSNPIDFKTTGGSASAAVWHRRVFEDGLELQDAFYCRGLQQFGALDERPVMSFIVQETAPPYLLNVHRPTPAAIEYADQRIEIAIRTWAQCLRSGRWPGYPSYVNHIDPPPWVVTRHEERLATRKMLRDAGSSEFERAMEFYRPIGSTP